MTPLELFDAAVDLYGSNPLVTDTSNDISLNYKEMKELSDRIALALLRDGLDPEDAVGILSPNHYMVLACHYGLLRAGGIWSPLNYRNTVSDNARQLGAFDVKWLFFHSNHADQIKQLRAELPDLKGVVCIDRTTDTAPYILDWLTERELRPLPFPDRSPSDFFALMSTSGTSGVPKGVLHTNSAWRAMIATQDSLMEMDDPPIYLAVAPLSHAAGALHWTVMPRGAHTILLGSSDPADILAAVEKYRISVMFLPPTLIYMLLSHPDLKKYDYSSLRYFIYGAAPISVDKLKEAAEAFGPVMQQYYGQTEFLLVGTVLTRQDHVDILENTNLRHRIASAGRAGPSVEAAILADDGTPMPANERGEIVFRGPNCMHSYYKNPEATAETSALGWHHTGDIGYQDEDGYIYLVDRKRDIIISGGFNIFPGEVEQALLGHPDVQDCVVVGVPDPKWGEMVVGAIELKPSATFDEQSMIALCKQRIGSVKAPKRIEVWDTLPRSTVGKTLRRVVRDKYWDANQRKI